ncbi:Mu transposase C-terminal domain-containing protein [Pseudonocardia xinjiangensis]|uniref:Mu transposase C-terminal domain-containing protein n=1 Tax=Pseudonocardia xinjiangensis TaxID=75289 RepID=UPI003D922738
MQLLHVGDRVLFEDAEHQVAALAGTWVRLVATADGTPRAILLTHLVGSSGFEILGVAQPAAAAPLATSLEDLSQDAAERARAWERHIVEVETGLPPRPQPDARPRPEFDPQNTTVRQREAAKAAELTAAGTPTSAMTVQRMRHRYRAEGLRGLIDGRARRTPSPHGWTDERVVVAIREALSEETPRSTGTRDRLRRRVEAILAGRYSDEVRLPSKATFNRLVFRLSAGRHTFGAATARRSAANRPGGAFTASWAARPGQQVQIDSTALDVMAVFDDGQARRVELIAAVDVATRTICAAILRPVGTKAIDAVLLLARMLVPEPMRPGWADTLRMSVSRLPHRSLADLDSRMEQAAAKPAVLPETIVCDRGKIYLSETFRRSCEFLGISLQPTRPHTPTDKAIVERTFGSINTLFCQHVAGYTGRAVSHRGADVQAEAAWSLAQLQDLLDEWIVAGWQTRPHDGLVGPDTGRTLSPNEMYAVLVSVAGHVPVMLTAEHYLEMLPSAWRTINDYGVRIDRRTYDATALNPFRRQHSGVAAQRGQWEVRFDPYDLSQIWVRNHYRGGWIRAVWTHLPMVSAPFTDFAWRHARRHTTEGSPGNADETSIALSLSELLDRAGAGPASPEDKRIAARTRAAAAPRPPIEPVDVHKGDDDFDAEDPVDEVDLDMVVPFGVFDAQEEARRWR